VADDDWSFETKHLDESSEVGRHLRERIVARLVAQPVATLVDSENSEPFGE
jgi:hypothetical protein